MVTELRKYGVTLDDSTDGSVKLTILPYKAGTNTFATSGDWSPVAADFKVSKKVKGSGWGSEANIGTAPTWVNGRVVVIVSGTELTCQRLSIRVENAAINSEEIIVLTYGNASAEYPTDYVDGVRLGMTALPNAAAGANGGLPLSVDASGRVDVLKVNGTSQTARDLGASVLLSSGTGTGQLSLSSGAVTVGTNNDKTGYTASTVSDKTGYSLANGSIAAATFAAGAVDATAFAQGAADKVWSTAARTITGGTIGSIAGVTFPANFSVLSITPVTGRIDLGKWLGDVPGIVDTGDGTIPVHLVACQDSAIANNAFAPNAIDAGAFAQGAADKVWLTIARTITGGTITTYTGDTPQTGDAFARLGAPAGANVSADVAAVKADTGNLVTRIPAALFAGITSLAQWLGLLAGKQVGNATARTEIRATGAGAGTFDETTDSEQAIRDRGDAAWTTGAGGGSGTPVNDEETIVESDETINVS